MSKKDTISAIATAFGNAAVAVIRISGPKSLNIVRAVFLSSKKDLSPRQMYFGKLVDKKELVDEVMACYFKAPNSFTGEDAVEIYSHGGYITAQKVLNLILSRGARLASPGEFTERAFLNGKIDLTQAEAIADIVYATSEKAQSIAQNQLDGVLGTEIKKITLSVLDVYSHLSTQLDFPDEDVEEISKKQVAKKLEKPANLIKELLASAKIGSVYKNGVRVAIVGLPNAGKSSLLNALVKDKRAIVTDIPGTTRDVLESPIELDGILVRLFDTAGITNTEDKVEKEGVKQSLKAIKDADIILLVVEKYNDIDKFLKHIKNDLYKILINKKVFLVKNKQDKFKQNANKLPEFIDNDCAISAYKKQGIKKVEQILSSEIIKTDSSENIYITSKRQEDLLKKALKSLQLTQKLAIDNDFEDKILIELDEAKSSLQEILGQNITEDILKKVFSRFCIGK
ncbi:tRNA uridine-5-carboxymethylaminomethyl(34) synthesis GTPase MnmE [bacterium]|nr:tRNA uridine-5-carboxymethylaminomethyl(34) synthesis GTPase MnmE [bacterium]